MAGASLTLEEWHASAPLLAAEVAEEWELRLGDPYVPGAAGHVVRADLPDGTPAVLKLHWPHRESEQEADALERWDGEGAVRLLARDGAHGALLVERCKPGAFLSTAPDPLGVLIGLLPRLWRSGDGFRPLAEEAAHWLAGDDLAAIPDRRLREATAHYLRELPPTQGEQVLLHQDLHGENVLAAEREPWLAIDPKPLAGEREFAVAPIVRSVELGHSKRDVLHRLDRLTAELGLDRERTRGWTIAQTVAWAADDGRFIETHLETARWLLEDV
ncbi:MAG TPA: aminoglycoside phosphotransferase family protein [Gaiellaceae bacterium]|nr:aminoglycoside phosphotransferase family protein [Gaiellaceae bacterium]